MTEEERWKQYLICKHRGHTPSDFSLKTAIGYEIQVCKWCRTHYRFESKVIETSTPIEPVIILNELG